jgi:hypothetical protein
MRGSLRFSAYFLGSNFILMHTLHIRPHLVGWLTSLIMLIQIIGLTLSVKLNKYFKEFFTSSFCRAARISLNLNFTKSDFIYCYPRAFQ